MSGNDPVLSIRYKKDDLSPSVRPCESVAVCHLDSEPWRSALGLTCSSERWARLRTLAHSIKRTGRQRGRFQRGRATYAIWEVPGSDRCRR